MPIMIHRCHDENNRGAETIWGLSEWQIAEDINRAMKDYLVERGKLCLRLEGRLGERIEATNYAHRTEGVSCSVEVHENSLPDEDQSGFSVLAWHSSRLACLLGTCILDELTVMGMPGSCRGLNRCSSTKRWIGTRDREYTIPEKKRLAMLQDTRMPAVIVEACYLTNPREAQWIAKSENRVAVGEAVARGIITYLKER